MSAIRELVTVLRYEVNNSGLRQYVTGFRNVMGRLRAGARNVREIGVGFMEGARLGVQDVLVRQRALNAAQAKGAASVERMGQGYRSIANAARSLVAGLSAVSAARIADEWSSVEARVGLVTSGVEEQKTSLEEIYAIAQRTRQEYTATGDLFQKIQRNAKDLHLDTTDSLQLTEIIGKAMGIGGGSAGAQQAALTQLGQALGAGVLRGDELNSIIEQAPRLAQAIAEAFGVSVGQLKELGEQGKLTSNVLAKGLLKQAGKINAEFERMPKTFGGAMVILKNALGREVDAFNRATGASRRFAAAAELVAANLREVLKTLALIGASYAITRLQAAMVRLRAVSLAALLPFLRMAAVLGTLYLIGQDVWGWLNGWDSVTGDVLGDAKEWQKTLDKIRDVIHWIKDAFDGAEETIGPWIAKVALFGAMLYGVVVPLVAIFKLLLSIVALAGLPAVLIALAVAALIALGVYIYRHWDELKASAKEAWKVIKDAAGEAWDKATDAMGEYYDRAIDWIKGIGKAITDWIVDKLSSIPIPDWLKRAATWAIGGGTAIATPGQVQAPGSQVRNGGATSFSQSIVVHAANANPAAVADATQVAGKRMMADYQRGFGGMVPAMEAMP
jgi:tape measure domain-containing protein